MDDDPLTRAVIGAAIEVHRHLGPGLLESAYQQCLARELQVQGIPFQREIHVGIRYKGLEIQQAFRADFLVAEQLILELKALHRIEDSHKAQLLTYLKWTGFRVGLLINFNERLLRNGIFRVINSHQPPLCSL